MSKQRLSPAEAGRPPEPQCRADYDAAKGRPGGGGLHLRRPAWRRSTPACRKPNLPARRSRAPSRFPYWQAEPGRRQARPSPGASQPTRPASTGVDRQPSRPGVHHWPAPSRVPPRRPVPVGRISAAASADRSARAGGPRSKEVPSLLKHPETRGYHGDTTISPGLQRVSLNMTARESPYPTRVFFGVVRK